MAVGRSTCIAVLAALALAGCMGGEPISDAEGAAVDLGADPAVPGDTTVASAILDPTLVPLWNVGDAWAITAHGFGPEEQSFLVVTAASGDAYTLATTSEQTAGFDAMFDVSYLGQIRASDLAGSQQGSPVAYFSWPLSDGKTWTAQWDGAEVALTATKNAKGGFDIVGTVDGADYVHFDYDPALKWWSHLEFVQDGYGIKVNRLETGWKGMVASAVAKEVYTSSSAAPVASPNSGAFTIDEGQTFGMVTLVGGGSQWARAFYLLDPAGMPYPTTTINNFEASGEPMHVYLQERIPATPGEWHVVSPAAHDPAGAFTVTVHQVAVSMAAFP